jgi:hypothetical protein
MGGSEGGNWRGQGLSDTLLFENQGFLAEQAPFSTR